LNINLDNANAVYFGTDTAINGATMETTQGRMFITFNDYQRILGLIEFASLRNKTPETVNQLMHDLKMAKMLSQENISRDIVTMNSRVLLRDVSSGKSIDITITYPQDADNINRKISVFTPIGHALLGKQVGDIVSWKVPGGIGKFRIEKLLYQPEAAGDFHL
jgi:regulator of nucleoside diphosphate kinase